VSRSLESVYRGSIALIGDASEAWMRLRAKDCPWAFIKL